MYAKKPFRYVSVFALLFFVLCSNAQTDTKFWFAAPDISHKHGGDMNGNGRPFYLHLSALERTEVTIDRPSDPFFPDTTVSLAEGESFSLRLDNLMPGLWKDIEVKADGKVQPKGFEITATPGKVTAFYELNGLYNRDIFTLKGSNALGTEFTVSTQNIYDNESEWDARSGFVVVATRPNTTVTVDLPVGVDYEGHPGGGTVTVTLPNPGDAYAFQVVSHEASQHPQGVRVISNDEDKPIAVTVYDDSMNGKSGCRDTYGDQIVPDVLLGREYIVMKGHLGDPPAIPSRAEYIFVTAISDATDIDTGGFYVKTINKGDVYPIQITERYTRLKASNPVSVAHITGTGGGCEQGGAILPPVDGCTGSNTVTFAHSTPESDDFHLNLLVRTNPRKPSEAAKNFTLHVAGVEYEIPSSFFEYSSDSSFAFLIDDTKTTGTVYDWINAKVPAGTPPTVATIKNPKTLFHLGVLHGGVTNGAKYGYFSNYSANGTSGIELGGGFSTGKNIYCDAEPFRLFAYGGKEYTWSCKDEQGNDISDKISGIKFKSPYFDPDTAGIYNLKVDIKGTCDKDSIISLQAFVYEAPVSDFTIDKAEGCTPLEVLFENKSDAEEMIWKIEKSNETFSQDTVPARFKRVFKNESDVIQAFEVSLTSYVGNGLCSSSLTKSVKVFPDASRGADFTVTSVADDCESKTFLLENTKLGEGVQSFAWDLGNGETETVKTSFEYAYLRSQEKDSVFNVILAVTDTNGCSGADTNSVNVEIGLKADYLTDTSRGCSPLSVNFTGTANKNTEDGAFKWIIGGEQVSDTVSFETELENTSESDSLFKISLVVSSGDCSDTVIHEIEVFPVPKADFQPEKERGCSPWTIHIANNSFDAEKSHWYLNDKLVSTDISPELTLMNYSGEKEEKRIRLDIATENNCVNTIEKTVEVLPSPKAVFEADKQEGISPLIVNFVNKSEGVKTYHWDFSDGFTSFEENPLHIFIADEEKSFVVKMIVKDEEECADTSSLTIKVKAKEVSSLAELKNEKTAYYFDQLLDQLYVNLSIGQQSDVKVSVFNLTGRLEVSKSMKALLPGEHQEVLYLERLVAGAYILRIETDNEVISGKFIKR